MKKLVLGAFVGLGASVVLAATTITGAVPVSLNNTVYAPVLDAGSIGVLGAVESFVGSGSDAYKVLTNGARYHIGAGASDYCSSDGTTVTFAGPIAATAASGVSAVTIPTNAKLTLDGAGTDNIRSDGNGVAIYSSGSQIAQWNNGTGNYTQKIGTITSNVQDGLLEKMGTSTTFLGPPLVLATRTTPVGNVGVGEDTLQTVTMGANAIVTTGHCAYYTFTGTLANNVNAKTINVYFGATVVLAVTAPISIGASFNGWLLACRTGSSTQRTSARAEIINTATNAFANVFSVEGTATETETGTIVLKLTGTATADNDIVENLSIYQIY